MVAKVSAPSGPAPRQWLAHGCDPLDIARDPGEGSKGSGPALEGRVERDHPTWRHCRPGTEPDIAAAARRRRSFDGDFGQTFCPGPQHRLAGGAVLAEMSAKCDFARLVDRHPLREA